MPHTPIPEVKGVFEKTLYGGAEFLLDGQEVLDGSDGESAGGVIGGDAEQLVLAHRLTHSHRDRQDVTTTRLRHRSHPASKLPC